MKHLLLEAADASLVAAAKEIGIELSAGQRGNLLRHLDFVLEANRQVNLTAITDPEKAIRLHVIDSLTAVPYVIPAPSGDVVDIGSGAGFPGIPVAIATNRHVDLLESIAKKAKFISSVVEALELNASAESARAEELARVRREHYAVATARAVAELPVLAELAAPLLMPGGRLVALKGNPDPSELDRGRRACSGLGLSLVDVAEFNLPGSGERRAIVVFEKVGETPARYPRRPGMAQKKPLA